MKQTPADRLQQCREKDRNEAELRLVRELLQQIEGITVREAYIAAERIIRREVQS